MEADQEPAGAKEKNGHEGKRNFQILSLFLSLNQCRSRKRYVMVFFVEKKLEV